MTNIQKIESAINESRRGRFLMYDNPESANKKIVIDTDSNILNIVTIKDKKICSCTCGEEIPCKHMIKVSSKYRLDINLKPESTIKPRKKSTAKAVKSNLKIVGK